MNKFEFDSKREEFSFKNALAMLEASALAYKNPNEYEPVLKGRGFTKVCPLNKLGTQGYVARGDDVILVAFRGTETKKIEDVLTDLLASQKNTDLGKVHFGFWKALNWVWDDLLTALKECQDNNQDVWITGHSLGGALATLATARLAFEKKCPDITGVYTYGKPRVGDKKFRAEFNKLFNTGVYRLTNYRDPVTIVPFSIKIKIFKWKIVWQYKHAGEMILFKESGEIATSKDYCARWVLVLLPLLGALAALIAKLMKIANVPGDMMKWFGILTAPHALDKYKENIKKNLV